MKEAKDYNPSKDPRLINCKTECGNDKCYARRYGLFAEKTCQNFVEPKPTTNADRIRAMTDEELCAFLCDITDCPVCPGADACEDGCGWDREKKVMKGLYAWLKQDAQCTSE